MAKKALSLILLMALWAGLAQAWTEPRIVTDNGSSKPLAAVSGKNIYVVDWKAGDFDFLSSSDNGRAWSEPTQPADTFYGGSSWPDIEYTSNGLIHVVWVGQYEGISRSYVFHQASSDGGQHWSNRHLVVNSATEFTSFPNIASNEDTLFVAFRLNNNLMAFRSFNSGLTWCDSTVIDVADYMNAPPIMLYAHGRLHLIYELNISDGGEKIYYSRSDDQGLTWTPRIYLSSYEPGPPYYHSQVPSAYIDEGGHIIATWMDYQYGWHCDGTGEIMARISIDNGDTWLPETRVTNSQTGEAPGCLILNDTLLVAWPDVTPMGCDYLKILISYSIDLGLSWSQPEIITGDGENREYDPFLFFTQVRGETFLHCLYDSDIPYNRYGLIYIRNKPFYSKIRPMSNNQLVSLKIEANSNFFDAMATITYKNEECNESLIEIYDVLGRKVWSKFVQGKEGQIAWYGNDNNGTSLSSGVYFAKLISTSGARAVKILLLK